MTHVLSMYLFIFYILIFIIINLNKINDSSKYILLDDYIIQNLIQNMPFYVIL